MTTPASNQNPLGWWMERRSSELRLGWDDVAERAGLSRSALSKIRNGSTPRASTRRDIEDALRWTTGSVDSILAGKSPIPKVDETSESSRDRDAQIAELQRMAAELTDYAERLKERITELSDQQERRASG